MSPDPWPSLAPDSVLWRRRCFVNELLALYSATQGTLGFCRRADRALAGKLFDRGVSLAVVETAFILAAARRASSPSPLLPIRVLAYFLPVIEECLAAPPDPGYLAYLRYKHPRFP